MINLPDRYLKKEEKTPNNPRFKKQNKYKQLQKPQLPSNNKGQTKYSKLWEEYSYICLKEMCIRLPIFCNLLHIVPVSCGYGVNALLILSPFLWPRLNTV